METLLMEERLWEFIDGIAGKAEIGEIELLLENSTAWKEKYESLIAFRALLESAPLEQPSLRFSQSLMEEITRLQVAPAAASYLDKKIIYGIGTFFLIMIVGLLVYGFAGTDWSGGSAEKILPFNFRELARTKLWNSAYTNIFMMINTVLALMLLDKYIFRKKGHAT